MRISRKVVVAAAMVSVAGALVWSQRSPSAAPREAAPGAPTVAKAWDGRVFDSSGRALADASVEAVWIGADDAPRVLARASTDGAGAYRLSAEPGALRGALLLRATKEGYGASGRQVDVRAVGRHADFTLLRGATEVHVTVATVKGERVPGAEVVVTAEPSAGEAGAMVVFGDKTDGRGSYVARGIATSSATIHYSVVARGRGRTHGAIVKPRGDAPVEIAAVLDEGASLVGAAVDAAGRPVSALRVRAAETDGPWSDEAESDGAGRFVLRGAPRATGLVVSVLGDWVTASGADVPARIEAGAAEGEVRVVVEPAGTIRGRVVDGRGNPISLAAVRALPADRSMGVDHLATTDELGRFTLRGLRTQTAWTIDARHDDWAPKAVENVPARATDVEVRMTAGGALAGDVIDDARAPQSGVSVYVHRIERRGEVATGQREHAEVAADAKGRWEITHLVPGTYRVEIRSAAKAAWAPTAAKVLEAEVTEGGRTVVDEVRVARGGRIRGRILVDAGALPRAVSLALLPSGKGGAPQRFAAQVDRGGTFVVGPLEPGAYSLTVHDATRGYARADAIQVAAARETEAELAFSGRFAVTGVVVDAGGKPVEGAVVDVFDAGDRGQRDYPLPGRAPDNFSGNTTKTDAAGRFVADGVVAGRYQVRVQKAGAPPVVRPVDAPSESAMRIALPAGAVLSVKAPADKVVIVETSDGPGVSESRVTPTTGVARFDALPPGNYRVRAVTAQAKPVTVTLGAGEAKTVAIPTT